MPTTTAASTPVPSLRCGEVIERDVLIAEGIQSLAACKNTMLLCLHATRAEVATLLSKSPPASTRLTVLASDALVRYGVLSIQSGPPQWRHIVPLAEEAALRWLQDCVTHNQISVVCCFADSEEVTVMQWVGRLPAPDSLLDLASYGSELEDDARAADLAELIDTLTDPSAVQSADPARQVEQVELVTHSNWLLDYLERTEASAEPVVLH